MARRKKRASRAGSKRATARLVSPSITPPAPTALAPPPVAPAGATQGDRIVALALTHVGEKYILGAKVAKDNANWKGPWDCAEFASWLLYQVTNKLYGCNRDVGDPSTADAYTGYWKRDAETLGTLISIDEAAATPGAAILRFPQVNASGHIVISDGKGGTVEAHS